MANNRITHAMLFVFLITAAFFAGGWFFGGLSGLKSSGEVADLYVKDSESMGIFDHIPAEDLAAAQAVAEAGLVLDLTLPEDKTVEQQDGRELPSQIVRTDLSDIVGVAPKENKQTADILPQKEFAPRGVAVELTGDEKAVVPQPSADAFGPDKDSKRTMISAPVRYLLIRDVGAYKKFKTRARGGYPEVNFGKQMLVVLESDSNLPDKIFEIQQAEVQDGKLRIFYRVNILGLDKKINTHSVLVVDKTDLPIELVQIL